MKLWKYVVLTTMLLLSVTISGCFAQQPPVDATKTYADPMTENMLLAMNEDNYARFSQDFDGQMKNTLNETQYNNTIPAIKAKIGNYLSKEFVAAENKDGYTMVMYKAKFSEESGDVTVRSIFSEKNGKRYVSGLWLDSPKLRGN